MPDTRSPSLWTVTRGSDDPLLSSAVEGALTWPKGLKGWAFSAWGSTVTLSSDRGLPATAAGARGMKPDSRGLLMGRGGRSGGRGLEVWIQNLEQYRDATIDFRGLRRVEHGLGIGIAGNL